MPVYDYKCAACGAEFEIDRAFGAAGKVRCAKCRSTRTEKVFSAAGIVFRGSGFYVTDSKPSGSSPGAPEKAADPSPAAESKPPKPSTGGKGGSGSEG